MRASKAIVVFRSWGSVGIDGTYDWRAMGNALPAGATPLEITWLDDETGAAEVVELHGHYGHARDEIVAVRNDAISELVEHGDW